MKTNITDYREAICRAQVNIETARECVVRARERSTQPDLHADEFALLDAQEKLDRAMQILVAVMKIGVPR